MGAGLVFEVVVRYSVTKRYVTTCSDRNGAPSSTWLVGTCTCTC